jgi:hypothetical protein
VPAYATSALTRLQELEHQTEIVWTTSTVDTDKPIAVRLVILALKHDRSPSTVSAEFIVPANTCGEVPILLTASDSETIARTKCCQVFFASFTPESFHRLGISTDALSPIRRADSQ